MAERKTPRRGQKGRNGTTRKPWEPTARHLEWYRKWSEEMQGTSRIARDAKPSVTPRAVHFAVARVEEWFRMQFIDRVLAYRQRHTDALEKIAADALDKFVQSQGEVVIKTVNRSKAMVDNPDFDPDMPAEESLEEVEGFEVDTKTQTSVSHGDVTYLNVAVKALNDVRSIWGVNAPTESKVNIAHHEEIADLPMGQGHPGGRAGAIAAAAKAMAEKAERMRARDAAAK